MSRCGLLRPQRSTLFDIGFLRDGKRVLFIGSAKLQPFFRIAVYFIEITKIQ